MGTRRRYYSDDEQQFFECAQSLERTGGSGDFDNIGSGTLGRLSGQGGSGTVRANSTVSAVSSAGEDADWIKCAAAGCPR